MASTTIYTANTICPTSPFGEKGRLREKRPEGEMRPRATLAPKAWFWHSELRPVYLRDVWPDLLGGIRDRGMPLG